MRQHVFAIAGFIAMLPWAAPAQPLVTSQEGIALENQILQLQNQVQQMQGSGGGNASSSGSALGDDSGNAPAPASGIAAPSADIVGNLLNQVSQLQAQVQQLSGRVDTLQNQVDTQNAATQKAIGDLNFKVTGSATGSPAPGQPPQTPAPGASPDLPAPPPAAAVAPAAAAAPASSAAALHSAQLALAKRDYATAETNARAVLANTKSPAEGYKAQYILAQSLAGENRPSDAAIAYDNAYNRDRTGPYAPGSLLGLANSLTDIQQASAACDTLASLNSQFPTPPAGMGPSIQAAEKRANCN